MVSFSIALICGIIAPFVWGLMNIMDKFVVEKKVHNSLSFAVIAGGVNVCFGLIIALFLSWNSISFYQILFPLLTGFLFGLSFYLYYYLISKEEVSTFIGLMYLYPIVVAMLSFFILHERLSWVQYLGAIVIICGAILLSLKQKRINIKVSLWLLALFIINVAFYEFSVKLATMNLNEWNSVSLTMIMTGVTVMSGIFWKNIRLGIKHELRNIGWSTINESMTVIAMILTYFAMSGIPATIVSAIQATQPLAVLCLEAVFALFGVKLAKELGFKRKFFPIILIVIGIILIT